MAENDQCRFDLTDIRYMIYFIGRIFILFSAIFLYGMDFAIIKLYEIRTTFHNPDDDFRNKRFRSER